jgi:hypothetical protein
MPSERDALFSALAESEVVHDAFLDTLKSHPEGGDHLSLYKSCIGAS